MRNCFNFEKSSNKSQSLCKPQLPFTIFSGLGKGLTQSWSSLSFPFLSTRVQVREVTKLLSLFLALCLSLSLCATIALVLGVWRLRQEDEDLRATLIYVMAWCQLFYV